MHETIKKQMVEAMRAKDTLKVEVLRGLLALFSNELIAQKSSDSFLGDESAFALIKRSVKQRKDSIEQFEKGGRLDLAHKEKAELMILETFLPTSMSKEDIVRIVREKLSASGPVDPKKSGQFIGSLMKELKGKADGALVKAVVDEILK